MFICHTDLYTVTACTKGLSVYVHFQRLDWVWQTIPKLLFYYALNKQKKPTQATQTKQNHSYNLPWITRGHIKANNTDPKIFLWKERLLKKKKIEVDYFKLILKFLSWLSSNSIISGITAFLKKVCYTKDHIWKVRKYVGLFCPKLLDTNIIGLCTA